MTVTTDLAITGKPAQFGRGVMEEVGNKLLGRFADCLADELAAARPARAAPAAPQPTPSPSRRRPRSRRRAGSRQHRR